MEQHTIRDRSEPGGEGRLVPVRTTVRDPFRVQLRVHVRGLDRSNVLTVDGGPGFLEANVVAPNGYRSDVDLVWADVPAFGVIPIRRYTMTLADLTSRDAVLQALAEYDDLGRDTFLATYGIGTARNYYLHHPGHLYDSNAVVGAAHGYQVGQSLTAADFSGGEATVRRRTCLM